MTDRGGFIYTSTGRKVYPLDLRPADVDLMDIAHALSLQCRYTGHVSKFYSVAEHSCRMYDIVTKENRAWALLHDAAETWLSDMSRPLKYTPKFGAIYKLYEAKATDVVAEKFNLGPEPEEIHYVDKRMCATEMRDLMPRIQPGLPPPYEKVIVPWTAPKAGREFLLRATVLGFHSA